MPRTILLIHGAWLNADSWAGFKKRYEERGYAVVAPSWPHDERRPSELRDKPDRELSKVGQRRLVDHYASIIRQMDEPPIIIGHSLGGVVTQYMLNLGLGFAGVVIDPAPTPGVPLGPRAIVSALPVFSDPLSGGKIKFMSRKFFRTRFAQTVPPSDADEQYDRFIVPTPGKVYWDGITNAAGKLTWNSKIRPPQLLIAGGKDLIADESMVGAICRKQKQAASRTDYKVFPERSHWTCLDTGWEEVADYAINWIEKLDAGSPPPAQLSIAV